MCLCLAVPSPDAEGHGGQKKSYDVSHSHAENGTGIDSIASIFFLLLHDILGCQSFMNNLVGDPTAADHMLAGLFPQCAEAITFFSSVV